GAVRAGPIEASDAATVDAMIDAAIDTAGDTAGDTARMMPDAAILPRHPVRAPITTSRKAASLTVHAAHRKKRWKRRRRRCRRCVLRCGAMPTAPVILRARLPVMSALACCAVVAAPAAATATMSAACAPLRPVSETRSASLQMMTCDNGIVAIVDARPGSRT